jgi:3-isopropylmalate/(R)-2-methylmalate dehydratase small subunit
VVAESFSRLFFRNSVNLGFPLLSCKGVSEAFEEGNILEVDFRTGEVRNLTKGKVLRAEPLPEVAIRFLRAGGVVALLKQEYEKKRVHSHH